MSATFAGFAESLAEGIQETHLQGLHRAIDPLASQTGPVVRMASAPYRPINNFASNDYLGLSGNPKVLDAARRAIEREGAGSGASRLLSGTLPAHVALEKSLAAFKGTDSAVTFSSGYAAALGTIPALVGGGDAVVLDKLCHACLVDAARLSGATVRVFPHNDLAALEKKLRAVQAAGARRALVVAESVYSMDGDLAPLEGLVELKDRFGAWLFLDEAHAVGVLGKNGRGLADRAGVADRIEVQMGTLGKALGSSGAYICGSDLLADFLINRARSLIFSTAPPPSAAAAARAAVQILDSEEGLALIARIWNNIKAFCEAADLPPAPSPIIPIMTGSAVSALAASSRLRDAGFWVPAIRFPTVPRNAARLRVTLSAAHEPAVVVDLGKRLGEMRNAGLILPGR